MLEEIEEEKDEEIEGGSIAIVRERDIIYDDSPTL